LTYGFVVDDDDDDWLCCVVLCSQSEAAFGATAVETLFPAQRDFVDSRDSELLDSCRFNSALQLLQRDTVTTDC